MHEPGWSRSAISEVPELALPATSGHTIDQETAMQMTGFKVQPP